MIPRPLTISTFTKSFSAVFLLGRETLGGPCQRPKRETAISENVVQRLCAIGLTGSTRVDFAHVTIRHEGR